jgi:hypothetical protein
VRENKSSNIHKNGGIKEASKLGYSKKISLSRGQKNELVAIPESQHREDAGFLVVDEVPEQNESLFNKHASPNVSVVSPPTFMCTKFYHLKATQDKNRFHTLSSHTVFPLPYCHQAGMFLCLTRTGNQIWKRVAHSFLWLGGRMDGI